MPEKRVERIIIIINGEEIASFEILEDLLTGKLLFDPARVLGDENDETIMRDWKPEEG